MGDASDMADVERFMRSLEGKAHLEDVRKMLLGRRIVSVEFSNEINLVGLNLQLDSGDALALLDPSLDLHVLREQFAFVLDREYGLDYPQSKSG